MLKKTLLPILFLIVLNSFGQNKQITGKIFDKKNNTPLPYVTITCKDFKNKIIIGSITNTKGEFKISKLVNDKFILNIQFIGFKTVEKEVTIINKSLNLGTLFLEEDHEQLKEVEIQAETSTITHKIDRKVINVDSDLAADGANSLEMLQNVPSISVDPISGSVSLRGNENAKILVNGKPSNLSAKDVLTQIPVNSVKSVEIITNPSSKYNPEGMSGIINLILKKNTQIGFNGTVSTKITHSKNTRPSGNLNLNYKTGKVNYYGSYNTSWGDYTTLNTLKRTDKDLFQSLDFLNNSNWHSFKLGADIELNKKSTLSLYSTQSFDKNNLLTNTTITENNIATFNNKSLSEYNESNQDYNIDYVYNFDDKGHNIEIELNHSINKNPETTTNNEVINPTSNLFNFNNDITDTRKLWLANIDYSKPIKNGNLELGLEFRQQNFNNSIITDQEVVTGGLPTIQPVGNTNLSYDRSIYSAYINFNKKINKLSLQFGARFEQFELDALFNNTQQGATPVKDEIFTVYPSAYLTYKITDKDDLQLSYSRRVDRPSAYIITPIQEWTTPLTISRGNVNIRPQFTNSVEINYTKSLKKGSLSLGSFYRRTNDKIGRLIQIDPTNSDRQIVSFTNYDFADSYGFEASLSYKILKKWRLRSSFEIYERDSEGILNGKREVIINTRMKFRVNNYFTVTKKLSLQLSANYTGRVKGIQYNIDPYTMINASARLKVLNNKGILSLTANDIFNGTDFDYSSINPFPQQAKYILEYDAVNLNFSYRFGSGKNKAKRRKYRDDNESQGGLF